MKFVWGVLMTLVVAATAGAAIWYFRPELIPAAAQRGAVVPVAGSEQQSNVPHPESNLPRMKLEAQYQGPLADTVVQRWSDPIDGTICYLYLPIAVKHSPTPAGLYEYGANSIGSISCFKK